MFKQAFETSPTPHVTVAECLGNLVVRGSEEERIAIRVPGEADDVILDREGETFVITARSDCTLTCPRATTITVDAVRGNLKVEEVDGSVAVGTVHGNAHLRAVGPAAVEQVFGNLRARQAGGDLRAHTVRGNARVRGIEGSLSLGQVDGNLVAERLQGGLEAERVHGNVRLAPLVSPSLDYRLNADGNLTLHIPTDASLRLALSARGGVRSSIPGLVLEETEGQMRGTLGAGEASLEAQVGGHASVRPLEPAYRPGEELDLSDLEGLGAQIEARVAEAMSEMESRLDESLGRIDSTEVRRRVERVAEKARRAAERETERVRLRTERAERRWRRASGRRPRPRRTPATGEERMRVLRLVEEGKVTPEQAADLLSALEGR
jgi:hypothetical protein